MAWHAADYDTGGVKKVWGFWGGGEGKGKGKGGSGRLRSGNLPALE